MEDEKEIPVLLENETASVNSKSATIKSTSRPESIVSVEPIVIPPVDSPSRLTFAGITSAK